MEQIHVLNYAQIPTISTTLEAMMKVWTTRAKFVKRNGGTTLDHGTMLVWVTMYIITGDENKWLDETAGRV